MAPTRGPSRRVPAIAAALACASAAWAQPRPPGEFGDLYAHLEARLAAFDRAVDAAWDGTPYPTTFAAELLGANGNRGRQLLSPQALESVRLELDLLHSLGLKAVTVAIPFPLLYRPFLDWNGTAADFQGFVSFFANVADEVHARGMKLVVESGVLFPGIYSAGSGLNVGAYYPTLTPAEFVAGRSAVISMIVGRVRPDLINVGSEPDTEYRLSGQAFLRTADGFADMVRTFVERLATAGLNAVPVVAGTGTWQSRAADYVDRLCAIPALWGIDLHLYPVNLGFLEQVVALADLARSRGKHVTMLEAWLEKVRDSELGVVDPASDPTIFARDAYDFWTPLDSAFLAVTVKLAHVGRFEYLSPFWSRYFFAYLDYDQVRASDPPLSDAQIIGLSTVAAATAMVTGRLTDTARAYASMSQTPPFRQVVRRRLSRLP